MVIDQRLGTLVNSVTTALDGYRALASIQPDDTADTAPSLKINTTDSDLVEAVTAAVNAERRVSACAEQLEKIAEASSFTANNLRRQLHDTRGLLRIARIELRMPGFVPRWYRSVIQTVKNYPKLLQTTARAIRIGVDIARPLANAWSHFHHDLKMLILDSVELAAKDLEAVGKKWESEQSSSETIGKPLDLPPDFNLAKAREMILSGNAPPLEWRPFIVGLDFTGEAISDLSPLADLSSLESLDLESTPVSNIAPLSNLVSLRTLRFVGTRVSDLSPLAGLTALQLLSLVGTEVSDLSPLTNLKALQSLYLFGTKVSDVTPLAHLTALRAVDLRGTAVSDLGPLEALRGLETVLVENEARRIVLENTLGVHRDNVVRVMNSDSTVASSSLYTKRPQ
jgi:Leucine-rich repeat (LRR) protein